MYWEDMRPPNDLPAAKMGRSGKVLLAWLIVASIVCCAMAGGSGLNFLFSVKGKLKRSVAIPDAASAFARLTIKLWFIPAPAPCARVIKAIGLAGAIYSADTLPMVEETWREIAFVFVATPGMVFQFKA